MGRQIHCGIVTALAVVGLGMFASGQEETPTTAKPPAAVNAKAVIDATKIKGATAAPLSKDAATSNGPANPVPATAAGALGEPAEPAANLGPAVPAFPLPAPAVIEGDPAATALPPPALLDIPVDGVPVLGEPSKPGTLDDRVEQVQGAVKPKPSSGANKAASRAVPAAISGPSALAAPAEDGNVLPPATEPAGQPVAAAATPALAQDDKAVFTLPAEQLPMGRQSLGLTVDVVAPQVLNINQTATLKVVVKNSGSSDAKGVVVRDRLPEGLVLLSSQPEAQQIDALLSWHLGTIPAGTERVITLSVKPTKVGSFDHAATVTMLAGGKSRTLVREPKLKVEQTATSGKILKGQPVQFKIMVSNPGDGPVRNVTVQAKPEARDCAMSRASRMTRICSSRRST